MRRISCAIVSLLLSAAWAAPHHEGDHSEDHHHHYHHGDGAAHHHHHSHADGDMSCHKLSHPNADFAFKLFRSLNAEPGAAKNVFFSPVSVTTALSMLALGSGGETHKQLFSALGYGELTQDQVNEGYEHLLHMLSHAKDQMQLDVGNALALRDDAKLLHKFLEDVKHFYASEGFSVDFKDAAKAEAKINQYIASKTENKITDLVKGLNTDTVMVLINYVFFRGKWEKPFDAKMTTKADFQVDENTKVEVDMMRRTGRFDFYQDDDNHTTVIMLPYKGNTSMMVVLPDEGKMKEVEGFISREHIQRWHDSMFRSSVSLAMPKISISSSSSLGDALKAMGAVDAFSDTADFSGISAETKLKVSKIQHKAVLSVDETGTEAAAGTTIEIMPMSLPENMNLNRPFLLLILENSTKSILFMGKVSDPTAK